MKSKDAKKWWQTKFMPSYGEEIGKWKFIGSEYNGIVC
jgi:hypothetical protein